MRISLFKNISISQKQFLVFAVSLTVFFLYLWAFWPGLVTVDQYLYLRNIALDPIPIADLDYESFLFGIFNYLVLSKSEFYWQIFLQIFLGSFVVSYAFRLHSEFLQKPKLAYVSLLLFVLNPFQPQFLLLTERDILFGLFTLVGALKLTETFLKKDKPSNLDLLVLTLLAILSAGIRREGLLFVALLPIQIFYLYRDGKMLRTLCLQIFTLLFIMFFFLPLPFSSKNQLYKATSNTNVLGLKNQIFPILEDRNKELDEIEISKISPFLDLGDQKYSKLSKIKSSLNPPSTKEKNEFIKYGIGVILQNPEIFFSKKLQVILDLATVPAIDYYRPEFIQGKMNDEIKKIRVRMGWNESGQVSQFGRFLFSFSDRLEAHTFLSLLFRTPYLAILLFGLTIFLPWKFATIRVAALANMGFFLALVIMVPMVKQRYFYSITLYGFAFVPFYIDGLLAKSSKNFTDDGA